MNHQKHIIGTLNLLCFTLIIVLLLLGFRPVSAQEMIPCPEPLTTTTSEDPDCDGATLNDLCPETTAFTSNGCFPVIEVPLRTPSATPSEPATTAPPVVIPPRRTPTPIPDSDGDGVLNNLDRCPTIAGTDDGCLYRGGGSLAVFAHETEELRQLHLFTIAQNTLYHGIWENHRTQWTALPGHWIGEPVVVETSDESLEVFVTDNEGRLFYAAWETGAWSEWEQVPLAIVSSTPSIVMRGDRLDLFVVNLEGDIAHTYRLNGSWAEWGTLNLLGNDLRASSIPMVMISNDETLFVVVCDNQHQLHFTRGDDYLWETWAEIVDGYSSLSPLMVRYNTNEMAMFAIGAAGNLRQITWDGDAWSASWQELDGTSDFALSAVSSGHNHLAMFFRAASETSSQEELWYSDWDGEDWSPSESWGGTLTSAPIAFAWSDAVGAIIVGNQGELWMRLMSGTLEPWESLGRP